MPENEKIIYAGFLYDQNPTFVLIITTNEKENCSYLSLGKIISQQGGETENKDSEQALKKDLAKKLEVNPYSHKILQRNDGQINMTLNLTPETLKLLEEKHAIEDRVGMTLKDYEMGEGLELNPPPMVTSAKEKKATFVVQKVTKFEGILIEKVFFSNKNIYGNLMLSTCKQLVKKSTVSKSPRLSQNKDTPEALPSEQEP